MNGEPLRLVKNQLSLFGFGFFRNLVQNPWFTLREYNKEMPPRGKMGIALSPAGFSDISINMSRIGLLERREQPSEIMSPGKPRTQVKVTEAGIDTMLDSLVYRVTHEGSTIPELLRHPPIAVIVIDETDIIARVAKAISQPTEQQKQYWGTDEDFQYEVTELYTNHSSSLTT